MACLIDCVYGWKNGKSEMLVQTVSDWAGRGVAISTTIEPTSCLRPLTLHLLLPSPNASVTMTENLRIPRSTRTDMQYMLSDFPESCRGQLVKAMAIVLARKFRNRVSEGTVTEVNING